MADVRDKLLEVLSGLHIPVLKREVDVLEKQVEHVKLALHTASHQVTETDFRIHFVIYSKNN
jgi:hypothetical protein